jgi:hypothetical protein
MIVVEVDVGVEKRDEMLEPSWRVEGHITHL